MKLKNYEFKARVKELDRPEQKLLGLNPVYIGEDRQTDTYFNVLNGRLKLREGNIENALIYYERADTPGTKQADILLYKHKPAESLKDILTRVHGVKVIVEKTRRIYFIENVKFHFDTVAGLGNFIEVEAIAEAGLTVGENPEDQCKRYFSFFDLKESDYVSRSYSDLILERRDEG